MTLKIHSKRSQLPLDSLFCLPASSVFDKVSVLTYTDLAASALLLNLFAIFSYGTVDLSFC